MPTSSSARQVASLDSRPQSARVLERGGSHIPIARANTMVSKESIDSKKSHRTDKPPAVPQTRTAKLRLQQLSKIETSVNSKKRPPSPLCRSVCSVTQDVHSLETQYSSKCKKLNELRKETEAKAKSFQDMLKVVNMLRDKIQETSNKYLPEEVDTFTSSLRSETLWFEDVPELKALITFTTQLKTDLAVQESSPSCIVFENIATSLVNEWRSRAQNLAREIQLWRDRHPDQALTPIVDNKETIEESFAQAQAITKNKVDELKQEIKKLQQNSEAMRKELTLLADESGSKLLIEENHQLTSRIKTMAMALEREIEKVNVLNVANKVVEKETKGLRDKIADLENMLSAQEVKLKEVTTQYKVTDANLKQREKVNLQALKSQAMRDLKAKTELCESLECRIAELTAKFNNDIKILQARTQQLEDECTKIQESADTSAAQVIKLKADLAEAEDKLDKVRKTKKDLMQLVEKTKDNMHPQRNCAESSLWTELEASKLAVQGYREEINKLKEERDKMLLKFETQPEDASVEKLMAQLVRKEDVIKNLKVEVGELQKVVDGSSKKYTRLQRQLKEVQERMQGCKEVDPICLNKEIATLREQIQDMEGAIKELMTHNDELEETIARQSLELNQRDQLMTQQCSLLKVRDELITLLKHKDDPDAPNRPPMDTKEIENKLNNVDKMYSVLQEKQSQVDKLNRIVKMMEEQQDKAQDNRTQFELKIAELQKQLNERKHKLIKNPLMAD